MDPLRRIAALLLFAALAPASAGADGMAPAGLVAGRVTFEASPLDAAAVYAYRLAEPQLWKGTTDGNGHFRFDALPAGLYRIIAAKAGFLPAIVHLTRTSVGSRQFVDVQLQPESAAPSGTSFWELRRQIPPDVLRDLGYAPESLQPVAPGVSVAGEAAVSGNVQAVTGVSPVLNLGEAQLTGGRVDLEGEVRNLRLGFTGDFTQLQPMRGPADDFAGHTQSMRFDLAGPGDGQMQLTSVSNRLRLTGEEPQLIGLESHRLSWSQPLGEGHSEFTAHYIEESNLYRSGPLAPLAIPMASRSWHLEGSFATPLNHRLSLETGFRYRERESEYGGRSFFGSDDVLPTEEVELFGRGGVRVKPGVLVEYGLFSTLRDGTLWLTPHGGVVLQLGSRWQAGTSFSGRVEADANEGVLPRPVFRSAYYDDSRPCEQGEERCYRLYLARSGDAGQELSLGAVHREVGETVRLYFNRDFYNFFESLYLVEGDSLPEIQLALTRRLAPQILTRLQSSLAMGGGGMLLAGNRLPYENRVRYLVTSLDTQFERTSTGVFVAFHHLAQELSPVRRSQRSQGTDMALERLQVMLTQDLDLLDRLASDLALQLNMELSRGALPAGREYSDPEALRSRVTGGVAVKF